MRMQKMWSHLGKRWCKHKEASPQRQRSGRGDDKAGHCHCWEEFSAEKCFWNAYVIPHPRLIVRELRSILLQQIFPMSWNKTKHAFTGALLFKSTHFPVKMKVSHKLHLWFPQDFSLLLCFGSLRPLWYLSKAFPFAHLILITVYGNGNSLPPQGSNFEKREGKQVQYDCLGERHTAQFFKHFSIL